MTKPGTTTDPRPDGEPKSTGGLNLRTVLHAVRRHPLAFIGVLLLAGSAAGAVWMFLPLPKNAAAVVYHVNPDPGTLIHELRQVPYPQYKTNQAVILKSRKTLLAILDDPAVRNLPMVPRAEAVPWLDAYLSANYQNVEYFRIMVEGDDPEQLKTLVGAAGRVYERMSRERDNAERNRRERDLEKKCNELRAELKGHRDTLDRIAQQLGFKNAAVLAIVDSFDQNKLHELVTAHRALQADLAAARGNPAERERLEGEVNKAAARVEDLQNRTAVRNVFKVELEQLKADIAHKGATAAALAAEIEKLRVEAAGQARVTMAEEPHIVTGAEGHEAGAARAAGVGPWIGLGLCGLLGGFLGATAGVRAYRRVGGAAAGPARPPAGAAGAADYAGGVS